MATLIYTYRTKQIRIPLIHRIGARLAGLIPRRCMVITVGLLLLGLSIPLLMAIGLIPLTLWAFFISLSLMGIGGTLALIYCGEI